ncbi:MAG: hypothetical protein IBX55_00730 [Methyloprofundus sp.]|nr:hypothetical protein [Methyloprofundus sp.]
MSLSIESKSPGAGVHEFPNGFWPAFCIETPVANVMGCEYTERNTIKYEHAGFIGNWFSEEEALKIYELLIEYVKTDEYSNHRYFAKRKSQMDRMIEFLPVCGGFRVVH